MPLLCSLDRVLLTVFQIYSLVLLVYALVSWVPSIRGRWTDYLAMVVEPVLLPLRRIIPPLGGFDLSFLVLLLLINYVIVPLIRSNAITACFAY